VEREGFCGSSSLNEAGFKHHYMRILRFSISIVFIGVVFSAQAQKYSNEFLSIGVGARAQALGNAVVAQTNDVTAGVWNPAGLAAQDGANGLQIGAMHAEWFAGVGKFDYLGVLLPSNNDKRRLAVSFIRFGVDEIPNTLTLYESDGTINFDNLRNFSAADYAMLLSYAQKSQKKESGQWFWGGNVKVIHRRIGPFANSWGFGLDGGVQYHRGNFRFGAMAKDITTTFNAWTFNFTAEEKQTLEITNNEIPINSLEITKPQLILGVAQRFQFKKIGITPELDFIVSTDGKRNTLLSADPFSIDPAVGIEADLNQTIFLRVGMNQFQKETSFAGKSVLSPRPGIGVGIKLAALQIDYAYTDLAAQENTYSHIISLLLNIKTKR
jgi:hypothetical protein